MQSERLHIYQQYAKKLVDNDKAYYCFCTKERLDEVRAEQQANKQPPMYDRHCLTLSKEEVAQKLNEGVSSVIRMKVPRETQKTVTVTDGARGTVEFDTETIDDQVILKSDGFPTYHLAVVVDDHLMEITHVVRGEEWLSSYPKHKLLYDAFGWNMPEFYHTAILRNPDKSKMSKRHSHTNIAWYQEHGILPEALVNFLALMGWSMPAKPRDEQSEADEIFSLEEFIQAFDLKDLRSVGPIFDLQKLEWLNGEYIRKMSLQDLIARISVYNERYLEKKYSEDIIKYSAPIVQTRLKTLSEYDDYCSFFIETPQDRAKRLGEDAYEKNITDDESQKVLQHILNGLERIDEKDWHAEIIGEHMQAVAQDAGVSFSMFFMLLRVAISGKKVTPPLNESMEILGKSECIARIQQALS